ncbi:hypothetical protein [Phenylobacterium deserti]|uniref:Uncharacterized protein n=1 Tax=Phenylobacterium deserti TaxID=1914756 RepID=A0A328AS81_9CAUL|nr:hypothetical protein [Phenylobacterium deserti]RAK57487.1 hypothetical protein DJ018_05980 [Phenylobacterium deserti]
MRRTMRTYAVAGVSLAAHAVLIGALTRHLTRTHTQEADVAPPMAVVLLPRSAPTSPRSTPADRLPPARVRVAASPSSVAPRIADTASSPAPPSAPSAPVAPEGSPDVRNVLRAAVGCTRRWTLSDAEREACDQRMLRRDAPAGAAAPGAGLDSAMRARLDRVASGMDADRRYRNAAPLTQPYEAPDYDGEPYTGTGGGALGPDRVRTPSKRAARKLEPLKP